MTVWVATREVQKINTSEDDKEATQERQRVDCIGSIEAPEEDERRA